MFNEKKINIYRIDGNNLSGRIAIITTNKDFNYVEKQNGLNTFTLKLAAMDITSGKNEDWFLEMFEKDFDIRNNKYIIENDDNKNQIGVITNIEMVFGEKPGTTEMNISGYGVEWFFGTRIISPGDQLNGEGNLHYNTNYGAIFFAIFNLLISGQVASTGLKDNNVIDPKKELKIFGSATYNGSAVPCNVDFRMKNALEIMQEITQSANARGFYHYIYGKIDGNKIKLICEQGQDMTSEIIFDNINRANAKGLTINRDISEEANAYVSAGQNEGLAREFFWASNKNGANFKEVFVNGSDVGEETGTGTVESTLRERGESAIEETKAGESVSFEIAPNGTFIPWEDFKVGDKVSIQYEFKTGTRIWKGTLLVPVIEIGYDYVGQTITYDVKVGDIITFTNTKDKLERKNAEINSRR